MMLDAGTITGGTVTTAGELDLIGAAVLENGTLDASGLINVSGNGNAFAQRKRNRQQLALD